LEIIIFVGVGLSGDNNSTLPQRGPGNKFEINADQNSFDFSGIDQSGLRFRQLTSASAPVTPAPSPNMLSVNADGDVILVPGLGGAGAFNGTSIDGTTNQVQFGQDAVAGSGADLQNDRDVPMNNFDLYFTDPVNIDSKRNNVAIGIVYPLTAPSPARLTVEKSTLPEQIDDAIAGEFTAWAGTTNYSGKCIGVFGKALHSNYSTYEMTGGKFEAKGSTNLGVYAVWGRGEGDRRVWGGKFEAAGGTLSARTIGVEGLAKGAPFNNGVYGYTALIGGTLNYAVYGDLGIMGPIPPPCVVLPCPPVTFPDAAGYFNGDMVSTTSFYSLSDGSFKSNIQDIENPMAIISQLNPKSYTFSHELHPSMQMPTGSHYGLISQDVETILPGLVKNCVHPARYDSLGNEIYSEIDFKAVNYTELIPFLIAAVKEQQQTIEEMQALIANLGGGGNRQGRPGDNEGEQGNRNSIDVELQNAKSIILNVAVPNPFAEHTVITYFITDDVSKAQIMFYDNTGNILKTVDVNEKGAGQINVFAHDLSSGIYSYSLIADGKLIETKKMVKQ
jgi:hypothetical protein